jgi:protein O-mannosyl-transferase
MLVPVIGIVQVGLQSRADRYMYLPMVGLLIMLAWGVPELLPQRLPLAAAAAIACLACATLAYTQTGYWQNSGTLFQRALDMTHDNYVAEYNLANYLMNNGRGAEAIPHFENALRIHPNYPEAENNLGMLLGSTPGRFAEAIPHFENAARLNPKLIEARYNLAVALAQTGRRAEALKQYESLQSIQPTPEIQKRIDELRKESK